MPSNPNTVCNVYLTHNEVAEIIDVLDTAVSAQHVILATLSGLVTDDIRATFTDSCSALGKMIAAHEQMDCPADNLDEPIPFVLAGMEDA